jgi:hypothetical protein
MLAFLSRHARLLGVGVMCLTVGAAAGAIAGAGAAPTGAGATPTGAGSTAAASASAPATARPARSARAARRAQRARLRADLGRIPAVHAELVIPTRHGFRRVTLDRGFVQSVSGDTLTMTQATRTATYRTVTLAIPAGARIRNDGHRAALSSLKRGERVIVVQGLPHARVVAKSAR